MPTPDTVHAAVLAEVDSDGALAGSVQDALGTGGTAWDEQPSDSYHGLLAVVRGIAEGVIPKTTPPTTATDPGTAGDISYDVGFLYICVATNTWRRVAVLVW